MEKAEGYTFGTVDIVVFLGMLGISATVGIYYAIVDRKEQHTDNYYFGGKNMSPVPVGLSISVTFISAITIIGYPAETYLHGTIVIWYGWMTSFSIIIACLYYIPLVDRLNAASIYEYLELRFHTGVRKCASTTGVITLVLYMGMTVYIPGLALNIVTGITLPWTIVLTTAICTFYTALGGMKAVIWTDVLQTLAMVAGALAALIKLSIVEGGFSNVWPIAAAGQRINTWNFNPDPTIRYTFWTFLLGQGIGNCRLTCINQSICQRYVSCGSDNKARIAALISLVPTITLTTIAILTGTAMYVHYEGCDPLSSGKVRKPDQMMPYLVLEIFQDTPGVAGLFVAAGFSGTLSTVSSGINALASLILEDFILPRNPKLGQITRVTISKTLVCAFGCLVMCIAFIGSTMNATVIRMTFTFCGVLDGPLLGVFTLGMLFPWSSTVGVAVGQFFGVVFAGWVGIGSLLYGHSTNPSLPVSTEMCPHPNTMTPLENNTSHYNATIVTSDNHLYKLTSETDMMTDFMELTSQEMNKSSSESILVATVYSISFLLIPVAGLIVTVVVGLIASFITGANKASEADPKLFVPIIESNMFPEKVRKFFRFGVPKLSSKTKDAALDSHEDSNFIQTIDEKESVL